MSGHWYGRFTRDDLGQDLVEYALLLACLSLVAIAGLRSLGSGIAARYEGAATALSAGGLAGGASPGATTPAAGGSTGTGSASGGTGNQGNNGNHGNGNNGNGNGNNGNEGKKP